MASRAWLRGQALARRRHGLATSADDLAQEIAGLREDLAAAQRPKDQPKVPTREQLEAIVDAREQRLRGRKRDRAAWARGAEAARRRHGVPDPEEDE